MAKIRIEDLPSAEEMERHHCIMRRRPIFDQIAAREESLLDCGPDRYAARREQLAAAVEALRKQHDALDAEFIAPVRNEFLAVNIEIEAAKRRFYQRRGRLPYTTPTVQDIGPELLARRDALEAKQAALLEEKLFVIGHRLRKAELQLGDLPPAPGLTGSVAAQRIGGDHERQRLRKRLRELTTNEFDDAKAWLLEQRGRFLGHANKPGWYEVATLLDDAPQQLHFIASDHLDPGPPATALRRKVEAMLVEAEARAAQHVAAKGETPNTSVQMAENESKLRAAFAKGLSIVQ